MCSFLPAVPLLLSGVFSMLLFGLFDRLAHRIFATFKERFEHVNHWHLSCQDVRQHMGPRHTLQLFTDFYTKFLITSRQITVWRSWGLGINHNDPRDFRLGIANLKHLEIYLSVMFRTAAPHWAGDTLFFLLKRVTKKKNFVRKLHRADGGMPSHLLSLSKEGQSRLCTKKQAVRTAARCSGNQPAPSRRAHNQQTPFPHEEPHRLRIPPKIHFRFERAIAVSSNSFSESRSGLPVCRFRRRNVLGSSVPRCARGCAPGTVASASSSLIAALRNPQSAPWAAPLCNPEGEAESPPRVPPRLPGLWNPQSAPPFLPETRAPAHRQSSHRRSTIYSTLWETGASTFVWRTNRGSRAIFAVMNSRSHSHAPRQCSWRGWHRRRLKRPRCPAEAASRSGMGRPFGSVAKKKNTTLNWAHLRQTPAVHCVCQGCWFSRHRTPYHTVDDNAAKLKHGVKAGSFLDTASCDCLQESCLTTPFASSKVVTTTTSFKHTRRSIATGLAIFAFHTHTALMLSHRTFLVPLTPFLDVALIPAFSLLWWEFLVIQHFLLAFEYEGANCGNGIRKDLQIPRLCCIHFKTRVLLRLRGLRSLQACWCVKVIHFLTHQWKE